MKKVSFVIPAYNEEKNIQSCLESITKFAKKLNLKHEIIVVDNNSNDRTRELAQKYTKKVYTYKNRSISEVRNFGASKSFGDVLCFVDADTEINVKLLKKSVETFRKDSNIRALSCISSFYNYPSLSSYGVWFYNIVSYFLKLGVGQYIVISKSAYQDVNGFDNSLLAFEDLKLLKDVKKSYGKKSVKILWTKIKTSPRKFKKGNNVRPFLLQLFAAIVGKYPPKNPEYLPFWYAKPPKEYGHRSLVLLMILTMLLFKSVFPNSLIILQYEAESTFLLFVLFATLIFKSIRSFLYIFVFTLILEIIGVYFGIPFGSYSYDENISKIGIFGVPFFISVAWYVLGVSIARIGKNPILAFLYLLNIDIILEKYAVTEGLWNWKDQTFLVAPYQNFITWGIVGVIIWYYLSKKEELSKYSIYYSFIATALIIWHISLSLITENVNYFLLGLLIIFVLGINSIKTAVSELYIQGKS